MLPAPEVKMVTLGAIALFSEQKRTSTNGKQLKTNNNVHRIGLMFWLPRNSKEWWKVMEFITAENSEKNRFH